MADSLSWDPAQYALFADARSRPFDELLSRVGTERPRLVLDLGCGDGGRTLALPLRWPSAHVVGVDSSPAMLAAARAADPSGRVEWVEADLRTWQPTSVDGAPDVVISNAVLQWVPNHVDVLRRWAQSLAPDGGIAVQIPGNHDAPSHRLMRAVASEHPRAPELLAELDRETVGSPADYLDVLAQSCRDVDAWETTYLHVLDPGCAQESPVLEWMRGTGLRPVLDTLTDPSERASFVTAYDERLRAAYPRRSVGVALPFRRIFAVGRKAADGG